MSATHRSYRYYIVDLFDGCVRGTDAKNVADDHCLSEDHFVIDTGTWDGAEPAGWMVGGDHVAIEEFVE